jgi:NitT/TauT family transport system substrate-binding protein
LAEKQEPAKDGAPKFLATFTKRITRACVIRFIARKPFLILARFALRLRRFLSFTAICVTVVCALVSPGCRRTQQAETASGLTPIRLQLDWYPQPEHGGFFAAQLLGYYKAEGLDVTLQPLPQYGSVAQLVASGKADFGLGSSDQILEWNSNGLPLEAVSATMQHDPQAVMVHKDSPIRDFKDLEGHTIAAQTGTTWLKYVTLRYNLHQVRQVPSTLSIANFLADPGYVQQVFLTSEPFYAKQAGVEVRTLPISSSGYDPYRVSFSTRDFVAQHPDFVTKFVRASIRGWQAYLNDPAATNAMLLKLNPALDPAEEAYSAQALRDGGFITGGDLGGAQTGRMNAARWQTNYEQLKALGILRGPVDPATTYSLNFVP